MARRDTPPSVTAVIVVGVRVVTEPRAEEVPVMAAEGKAAATPSPDVAEAAPAATDMRE